MLQHAVVDEGQRLAGLDGGEQDQPTEQTRPRAIFLLRGDAVICGFIDHIRFHPDGEIARGRTALHRAELVVLGGIGGRDAHVDAGPAHRFLGRDLQIGRLQRRDGIGHRQHLADIVIVDDQGHAATRL